MKKVFRVSVIALIFAFLFPFMATLTGCGATPSTEVLSVHFESLDYDEETGYAIFEVDKDVTTELTYKVNPSSWSGGSPTYAVEDCTAQNLSRFSLLGGKITVMSDAFEEIKVTIRLNDRTDTCIVRLKEYPTDMFVYDQTNAEVKNLEVSINATGSYTISPYGRFADGSVKPLNEYGYNFTVTTSNETIIKVPNSHRLTVESIRGNAGTATVTVVLNDATGAIVHKIEVKINVVLNAERAFILLDGASPFIYEGDEVEIQLDSSFATNSDGNYLIGYQAFIYANNETGNDRYIESDKIKISCSVTEPRYVEVDNNAKQLIVETPASSSITFDVTIFTNLIATDGTAFSVTFQLTLNF